MLEAHQAGADSIGQRIGDPKSLPYDAGGKVPLISPHTVSQTVSVTEQHAQQAHSQVLGQHKLNICGLLEEKSANGSRASAVRSGS